MAAPLRSVLKKYAAFFLAAGLAGWLQALFSIEWSYPYCNSQEDGPAYAAFGMPLPYKMASGVSSMETIFMPHVYFLNLLLLCLIAFPFAATAVRRVNSPAGRRLLAALGMAGMLALAFTFLLEGNIPVRSIAQGAYGSYGEFRPVGFVFPLAAAPESDQCLPSSYWFPEGWKHH